MSSAEEKRNSTPSEWTEEEIDEWMESEDEETPEELDSPKESLEEKYSRTQLKVIRQTMDFTLHMLRGTLNDSSYINISPIYQRRNRWDRKKRALLIESFLLNIPIPPLYFFENRYNQYEVMDGRQRLESIRGFLNNEFALRGLEYWPELDGKRFNQLPLTLQRGLLRRTITAVVLLAETTRPSKDQDIDVRMALFRRLNTGGIKLNPQELRNALYPGLFNDMLRRAPRSPVFTRLWGIPERTADEDESPAPKLDKNTLYKTMGDAALVLRFFGIKETIEQNLKGSLRSILDGTMKRHHEDSEEQVQILENTFFECLNKLDEAFPENPFKLPITPDAYMQSRGRLSQPLYDAMMVATSLNPDGDLKGNADEIQRRLRTALFEETTYEILIGRANTVDAIKKRVAEAERILFGGA